MPRPCGNVAVSAAVSRCTLQDALCKCSLACEEPHLICVQTSSRAGDAQSDLPRCQRRGEGGGSLSRAACHAHKSHLHLNPDGIGRLLYGPRARVVDALCIAVSSLRAAWPFSQIVYGLSRQRKEERGSTERAQVRGQHRAKVDQQSGAKDPITIYVSISRMARDSKLET